MKIEELVQSAKRSAPSLKALGDEDAQSLLREVFKHIRRQLDASAEGKVKIGGLGVFRIRQVERESEGRKVAAKRIVFQAGGPKAAGGQSEAPE